MQCGPATVDDVANLPESMAVPERVLVRQMSSRYV
jgi:hypothetical protein